MNSSLGDITDIFDMFSIDTNIVAIATAFDTFESPFGCYFFSKMILKITKLAIPYQKTNQNMKMSN